MSNVKQNNFERYLKTYAGQHLEWPLSTQGTWQVFGEDPNCDLGGSHYSPPLGIYEGELGDVVRMAVELPNFWQWGAGGHFQKVKIQTIDGLARRLELNAELKAAKARVKAIEKELES